MTEFYSRLAKVKEYHRKYPDTGAGGVQHEVDFAGLEGGDEEWLDKRFTGEEGLGRYLDLHELHDKWNNLAPVSSSGQASAGGWRRLSYLQYLATCTDFKLSLTIKAKPDYSKYLTQLLSYLQGFYEKVFPLGDLDGLLREADATFAAAWEAGQVGGWASEEDSTAGEKKEGEGVWCAACKFISKVRAPIAESVCCFAGALGVVNDADSQFSSIAGQKSFAKETVYNAHLTGKKHLNAVAKLSSSDTAASTSAASSSNLSALRHQKNRALALKESLISALLAPPNGPLSSLLSDTRDNTERRAALTDKERAAEIEELEAREAAEAAAAAQASKTKAGEIEDDEEEEKIYNPLKLPLGWDGKPIPFWLYKLHGLGVEYKCEICSDFVYMGRKVFEKHFQESRHAFGMRALGLPNTKHFHEITKIEDAIACKWPYGFEAAFGWQ